MRHRASSRAAGLKAQPPHYSYRTRWYYQFHLIVVTCGRLQFKTGDETRDVVPGHAAVLRVGSTFELSTGKEGYHGVYFIDMKPEHDVFTGRSDTLLLAPQLRAMAELMETESSAPYPGARDIVLALGLALAWQTARQVAEGESTQQPYGQGMAERAREALDLSLRTGRTAHTILAGMGLSYRQVARHFKKAYGTSPKHYQLQARIREASAMLSETRMPMTAIAHELGFSSSQHFATQFKHATGLTPRAFRTR